MTQSNIFDLVLAAVFLAAVIFGAKKGALRAVSGLLGMILGFWATHKYVPLVEPVVAKLVSPFVKSAVGSAAQKTGAVAALDSVPLGELTAAFDEIAATLGLSPEFGENILHKARTAGETMQTAFVDGITGWLAPLISFALIFLAAQVAVTLLCNILSTRGIPLLSAVNTMGGALLGAVYGLAAVVVLCWAVLAFAPQTPQGMISAPVARGSVIGSVVSGIVEK